MGDRRLRWTSSEPLAIAAPVAFGVAAVGVAIGAAWRWHTANQRAHRALDRLAASADPAAVAQVHAGFDAGGLVVAGICTVLAAVAFGLAVGLAVAQHRRRRLRHALHPSIAAAADRKIERILAEHAQDLVTMVDAHGRLSYVSPSASFVLGRRAADLLGAPAEQVLGIDPLIDTADLDDGEPLRHRVRHADGGARWLETLVHHLDDDRATGVITLFSSRDVTERVLLEQTLEAERRMLGDTLANVHAGIMSVDNDGKVIDANAELCSMLGFRPLTGTPLVAVEARYTMVDANGEPIAESLRPLAVALGGETVKQFPATLTTEEGRHTEVIANAGPLIGSDGRRNGAVLTLHDVSELRAAEAELRTLAEVDPLTGLANRRRLGHALATALGDVVDGAAARLAVLFLDLDGFKRINDIFGHEAGDDLLVAVGGRLSSCVRGGDTVARLGGDEFVIVVDHLHDPAVVGVLIDRIERALAVPFEVGDASVVIGASIGVAHAEPGSTAEALLGLADREMYERKRERADRGSPLVTLPT